MPPITDTFCAPHPPPKPRPNFNRQVSRQNFERYGHPDGPQGFNIGIALPAWMFSKDKKTGPIILVALVGGCILLPLAAVSYHMLKVRGRVRKAPAGVGCACWDGSVAGSREPEMGGAVLFFWVS